MIVSKFNKAVDNIIRNSDEKTPQWVKYYRNSASINYDGSSIFIICSNKITLKVLETNKELIKTFVLELFEKNIETNIIHEKKFKTLKNDIQSNKVLIKNKNLNDSSKNIKPSYNFTNLDKNLNFQNYIISESNNHIEYLKKIINNEKLKINPVFIYGKTGSGKTHILNAIGNYLYEKKIFKNIYLSNANDFSDHYNKVSKEYKTERNSYDAFYKKYESLDVFLFDDIQFLSGREKTTECFFKIFNHFINKKKPIIIVSDTEINNIRGFNERMISRFSSGLVIKMQNLQKETLCKIIYKFAEKLFEKNFDIEKEGVEYIANSFSDDVRGLNGAINNLWFYSITDVNRSDKNKKITLQDCKEALKVHLGKKERKITMNIIIDKVANVYVVEKKHIIGKSRKREFITPRHIAMYLGKKILKINYKKITNFFAVNDHTSVMHAYDKISKKIKNDKVFSKIIEKIEKELIRGV